MILQIIDDGIIDRAIVRESDENQTWIGDFRIGRSRIGIENKKIVDDMVANLLPTEADMGKGVYRIGFEKQTKILKLLLSQPKLPFISNKTPQSKT